MIDQNMHFLVAGRMDPLNDIGQNLAAIIATTRREWMSQGHASPAPDESALKCARFTHPLLRFALDAKRSS